MAFRTSNPTLTDKTFNRYAYLTGADPSTLMTIGGTINKASIILGLAIATAIFSWMAVAANSALAFPLVLGGAITGLIVALVAIFKPETTPVTAPLYGLVEGVVLGAISQLFNALYRGIVIEAVAITFAVLLLMLVLYRARVIRATPIFTRVVVMATGAIAIVYLISIGMMLFGHHMPFLNDATPLGIGISLFICVIASLNFILDFDTIERGANQGAPKFMEWYAAFGLMVTLFWLYLEVLRLLAKMRR